MAKDITIDMENITGYDFFDAESTLLMTSLPTPRTLSASSTTIDHTVCLEELPSPPKIPPSRADNVQSRVEHFNKWCDVTQTLARDSFLDDTQFLRSALRDVTQEEISVSPARKLKKQVSFAEYEESTMYLYTPDNSRVSSSENSQYICENIIHSPPPYEQIASRITNRVPMMKNRTQEELFFDAPSSRGVR